MKVLILKWSSPSYRGLGSMSCANDGKRYSESNHRQHLVRICFADYDREMALVAEQVSADGGRAVVAVGRLSRDRIGGSRDAEFSLLVADPWQGRGIGSLLLARLLDVGRREGMRRIEADILETNLRMQRLCARLGFVIAPPDGGVVHAVFDVPGA